MKQPQSLQPGDMIALASPASVINPEYVAGAEKALRQAGFRPVVMSHSLDVCGSYAGSEDDRAADLIAAFENPDIRAVICNRGGYGCIHLLPYLEKARVADMPKWIVGFSDVSAIHAFMLSKGVESIHASMAKNLAENPLDCESNAMLLSLLRGKRPALHWESGEYGCFNRPGTAEGVLAGGNLAVLQGLVSTPYDIFLPGRILFIEDIAEPVYKIERMLVQLRLAGRLQRMAGLIVGRFTDYRRDANWTSMEQMVAHVTDGLQIPVAFNAPIGHIGAANMPVVEGATVRLSVSATNATLEYI